jgi:hypothetical protein
MMVSASASLRLRFIFTFFFKVLALQEKKWLCQQLYAGRASVDLAGFSASGNVKGNDPAYLATNSAERIQSVVDNASLAFPILFFGEDACLWTFSALFAQFFRVDHRDFFLTKTAMATITSAAIVIMAAVVFMSTAPQSKSQLPIGREVSTIKLRDSVVSCRVPNGSTP